MRFTKANNIKFSALVIALLAMMAFVTKPSSTASAKASAPAPRAAAGPLQFVPCPACECFPSCAETDSRMLSLAGGGFSSFVGGELNVGFSSPGASANVLIGIFDPESSDLWDLGTVELRFELFADPDNDGVAASPFATFFSTDAGALAANNNWWDLTFPNQAAALSGGTYFYFLRITPIGSPPAGSLNGIKLRTDGDLSFSGQTIQLISKAITDAELAIIYPSGRPSDTGICPMPSTYNGIWDIPFRVRPGTTELEIWDGEFDVGDEITLDTDDPNTPSTNVCEDTDPITPPNCVDPNIPLWAQGTAAKPEGVQDDGNGPGIGRPREDNPLCDFRRSPTVFYRLLPPGADPNDPNAGYKNANPSGTSEWERFSISTSAADNPDIVVGAIPEGIWRLRIEGMDVFNQFALHAEFAVVPPSASIGDTVFFDTNANGTYEPGLGEIGIGNVTVDLLQGDATCTTFSVVGTQTTNASGNYLFTNLLDGCYRVTVTDTNNVLTAFTKTIGPNLGANDNSQVDPYSADIVNQTDNLTADFGYVGPGCNLKFPGIVKARPRTSIPFIVSNLGFLPSTVSVKPLFGSACFSIIPGFPQQLTIGPGQSAVFTLNAANCPINAKQFPQNSLILIQSSTCPTQQVQVEWVLR